jgi:hypothetical protein
MAITNKYQYQYHNSSRSLACVRHVGRRCDLDRRLPLLAVETYRSFYFAALQMVGCPLILRENPGRTGGMIPLLNPPDSWQIAGYAADW